MRIISKFSDFYDGVLQETGIDKTTVYKREQKTLEIGETGFPIPPEFSISDDKKRRVRTRVYSFVVGFCGKTYVGWEVERIQYKNRHDYDMRHRPDANLVGAVDHEVKFAYGLDQLEEVLNKLFAVSIPDSFYEKKRYMNFSKKEKHDMIHNVKCDDELFREHKTPVIVEHYHETDIFGTRHDKEVIINPKLKDLGFYRLFDPYTTLQEIQMYIGGVLGNEEKEMVEIKEKDRKSQKGVDDRTFRRDSPGPRKERRKRKRKK